MLRRKLEWISQRKGNEKLLNKKLRRCVKMDMISLAKWKWETHQQKVKKKAGKDGHLILNVETTPLQEKISYAKCRVYLQKVSWKRGLPV